MHTDHPSLLSSLISAISAVEHANDSSRMFPFLWKNDNANLLVTKLSTANQTYNSSTLSKVLPNKAYLFQLLPVPALLIDSAKVTFSQNLKYSLSHNSVNSLHGPLVRGPLKRPNNRKCSKQSDFATIKIHLKSSDASKGISVLIERLMP